MNTELFRYSDGNCIQLLTYKQLVCFTNCHCAPFSGANHPSAPAILQNFLGTNPQDLITHGLRRGAPLLVDVGYAILDSYENEMTDLDNLGGSSGRAALSSIPSALVRWNEESRVIDGDSVHDCVTALKPDIIQVRNYSGDLNRELVWYSNGPKQFAP